MAELKVRYHDGRAQVVPADRCDSQGEYWRFSLNSEETAIIAKRSVESITREDVPDPESDVPEVEASEFKRAPRTGAT